VDRRKTTYLDLMQRVMAVKRHQACYTVQVSSETVPATVLWGWLLTPSTSDLGCKISTAFKTNKFGQKVIALVHPG
jgi:hypothetical protein